MAKKKKNNANDSNRKEIDQKLDELKKKPSRLKNVIVSCYLIYPLPLLKRLLGKNDDNSDDSKEE